MTILKCHAESLKLSHLSFEGNIVPISWYKYIKLESGKPDLIAILILSDIVYWYRPVAVRQEQTGVLLGYRHKFKHDLLQKSYQDYADLFGLSKRQVTEAFIRLEKLGLIKRVFRQIQSGSFKVANVLFIELHFDRLIAITAEGITFKRETHSEVESVKTAELLDHLADDEGGVPFKTTPYIETEITSEITTKTLSSANSPQEDTMEQNEDHKTKEMISIWNEIVEQGRNRVQFTLERLTKLAAFLKQPLHNDLEKWRAYCVLMTQSKFLMGESSKSTFRATLDWALSPAIYQKVIERAYGIGDRTPHGSSALLTQTISMEKELRQRFIEEISSLPCLEEQEFKRQLLNGCGIYLYKNWFKDLRVKGIQDERILLWSPNAFIGNRCQERHHIELLQAAKIAFRGVRVLEIIYPKPGQETNLRVLKEENCYKASKTSTVLPTHPNMNKQAMPSREECTMKLS